MGQLYKLTTIELKKKLEESDKELLVYAITELRQRFNSQSKEIYSSISDRESVGKHKDYCSSNWR